ncbi:MAG: hypothetical protein GQ578_08640, partial [Desulfuromonadaceae bacterium]|nr:hypothetical protein [Desulfuromonadaceae bacterium]
ISVLRLFGFVETDERNERRLVVDEAKSKRPQRKTSFSNGLNGDDRESNAKRCRDQPIKALHQMIYPIADNTIEAPPHQFNPCELVRLGPFGFRRIEVDFLYFAEPGASATKN